MLGIRGVAICAQVPGGPSDEKTKADARLSRAGPRGTPVAGYFI
jgi:hypothetical protein